MSSRACMDAAALVARALEVFEADAAGPPPLPLRGGHAVDGYDIPAPFDPAVDEPTDAYLERFTFWGLTYLDASSWRHYLPRLIDYAFRVPDDPAMVAEALIRSLRAPDRYPPRLRTLDADQESLVRAFLEHVALTDSLPHLQEDAQQALEEWWLPTPRSRPTDAEVAALRGAPVGWREVGEQPYRLSVPETVTGSGMRDIPEESRRVETFGGYLCGDAHAIVAVNVTPFDGRPLDEAVNRWNEHFRVSLARRPIAVRGAARALRFDGAIRLASPAEPQDLTMVLAAAGDELVTLTVRSWPRADVHEAVERIVSSLVIVAG